MWRVCVVIPTKNEEATICEVMAGVRDAFDKDRFEEPVFLVVDDSTDGTRRTAREAGAKVLVGGGQGLGMAMFNGLKAAAVEAAVQFPLASAENSVILVVHSKCSFAAGNGFLNKRIIPQRNGHFESFYGFPARTCACVGTRGAAAGKAVEDGLGEAPTTGRQPRSHAADAAFRGGRQRGEALVDS